MIDYIKGTIAEILPTEMTLECHGIGYKILISLQSFEALKAKGEATVYIHHYLREDDEQYFGFATKDERELFRLLIGVSGVGAATARMMLSSMSSDELRNAILSHSASFSNSRTKSPRAQEQNKRRFSKREAIRISKRPPQPSSCSDSRNRMSQKFSPPSQKRPRTQAWSS